MHNQTREHAQTPHTPHPHTPRIHPTAIVHPSAKIAPTAAIGPYAVVGPEVTLGNNTRLHNHATVLGPATIGDDNEIFPYAVLGAEPQDLKYQGHHTTLIVGNRNKFREHTTVHRGTQFGDAATTIADDCLIMVNAHIAHDCRLDDQVVIANNAMIGGHCHLEFGATVAGGAGVHHFATVATLAFVGGMSRITKDVPPYCVVEGNPAAPRKINAIALARRQFPVEQIDTLRNAFRKLFRSPDRTTADAIRDIREQARQHPDDRTNPHAPALNLCAFLERCETGAHGRHLESTRPNNNNNHT